MITKENHEAIELLVASINQIQAKAEGAGLTALGSITFYSSGTDARLHVYPSEGANQENITSSGLNVTSYDTMAADLARISAAIEHYRRANTEEGALEQKVKELTAELEAVESRLKSIRDGKEAK